ncbi:DUF559 domain-containing protein [Protaetiibacter intestinalis]|nr:DUF559 domain-containing protein [Protaetiibacter intestinalis]
MQPPLRPHPASLFGDTDVLTRLNLVGRGASVVQLAAAVHDGSLIRIRRGYYGRPELELPVQRAVRVGGRMSCVSELRRRGVWTLDPGDTVHLQIAPNAARLRDRDERTEPLDFVEPGCRIHWRPLERPRAADHAHAGLWDALLLAVVCLPEREALAVLDSVLHERLMSRRSLRELAQSLPADRARLVALADAGAASGIETFPRWLCLVMGLSVRTQPFVAGAGYGDLEVEGFILVEGDSHEFHDAEVTARDRRRDAVFTRAGYTVLHFRYAQIVYEPREVAETILAAILAHRGIRNSGEIVRRARRRLDAAGIS